ncbi:hypothetical protein ACO1O0_008611 [Amphichorda felina]
MAKNRAPSKHSRAARRATSPSIDLDKSLKDFKPPAYSSGTQRPSVLAVHQSAGVQKKAKTKSRMSSKARRRHERGLQMGEAVAERTHKKVERSKVRGRAVVDRSKRWEDINKKAQVEEQRADEEESDGADGEDKGWETDEDMSAGAKAAANPESAPAAQAPADEGFIPVDDDEEIL